MFLDLKLCNDSMPVSIVAWRFFMERQGDHEPQRSAYLTLPGYCRSLRAAYSRSPPATAGKTTYQAAIVEARIRDGWIVCSRARYTLNYLLCVI